MSEGEEMVPHGRREGEEMQSHQEDCSGSGMKRVTNPQKKEKCKH